MSNIERQCNPSLSSDCPEVAEAPTCQRILTRDAVLGDNLTIRRALPSKQRRMIGAWCFLDHFGPLDVSTGDGLRIGPHPHIGLQTFTWPIAGEILHRDSLGYEQLIRPGQVNLMTAGRGIAHSEESPTERSATLHGAQLWIALPDAERFCEPAFNHYPLLPVIEREGFHITLLAGEALGELAPPEVHSPLMGMDLVTEGEAATALTLKEHFEYGVLVLSGEVYIEGETLGVGTLLYLGCGRSSLSLKAPAAAHMLLLGGEPFREEVLVWWNLVARSKEEITAAVADWQAGRRFGEVTGYQGARLEAPDLPWKT